VANADDDLTTDMVVFVLGLGTCQSLALYVICGHQPGIPRLQRSRAQIFLYWCSVSGNAAITHLAGLSAYRNTQIFAGIAAVIGEAKRHIGFIFGQVFRVVRPRVQDPAVPFHMWRHRDVYEGHQRP